MSANEMTDVLRLMKMEFIEMPDLKLTARQARRLFDVPADLCERALDSLVSAGFLMRTRNGAFLRRTSSEADAA